MFAKKVSLALMLAVFVAASASGAAGPSCSQVLDQVGAEAESFQAEAREMGMHFVLDEALQQSLDGVKGAFEPGWNPTMTQREEALAALRAGKDKLDEWKDNVKMWNAQLLDLQLCVNDPSCSLIKKSDLLNADIREWLESLGPEGASAAAQRVNKAATLLQGYTSRLTGTATSSVSSAIACMDESAPQQASAEPVDLQETPAPPAAQKPAASGAKASGGKGGRIALATVGAGAAVALAVVAGSAMADMAALSAGSTVSNRFCVVSVMGHGCDCAGSVTGGTGWTGPTAGEGGGCGAGMPCVAKFSCNNGRCEGPGGRCRF
jgi:hypothetical protein